MMFILGMLTVVVVVIILVTWVVYKMSHGDGAGW